MPEESIKNTLHDIAAGKNFLNRTSVGQELSPSVSRWDSTKLRSPCERRLSAENTDTHRMGDGLYQPCFRKGLDSETVGSKYQGGETAN